jgi:hypothetical protein
MRSYRFARVKQGRAQGPIPRSYADRRVSKSADQTDQTDRTDREPATVFHDIHRTIRHSLFAVFFGSPPSGVDAGTS